MWSLSVCVNLPREDCPHKLSDPARRQLLREDTKSPRTTLKGFKSSAAEMGETLHTGTVSWALYQSSFVAGLEGCSSPLPNET